MFITRNLDFTFIGLICNRFKIKKDNTAYKLERGHYAATACAAVTINQPDIGLAE